MISLYINTTENENVEIAIKDGDKIIARKKFKAKYSQSKKLLPEIDKLLKENKIKLKQIKMVEAENGKGTFTSLRIGIATANALSYALGIKIKGENIKNYKNFSIIKPQYDKAPNITRSKKIVDK